MEIKIRKVTTEDREREALRALARANDADGGLTIKDIWKETSEKLEDTVTQQAFYKLLARLEAVGKIEALPGGKGEPRQYRLAPYLFAENAMTLDDLYEQIGAISAPDAVARFIDARDYFEENRDHTIRKAAEHLLSEDPRTLVKRMIMSRARALSTDIDMLNDEHLRDRDLEARIDLQIRNLRKLTYRCLGLSRESIDIARSDLVKRDGIKINEESLERELRMRVFGETFIQLLDVRDERIPQIRDRVTVSGSDGTTRASFMQLTTAGALADEVGVQTITFNNSVAFVDFSTMDEKVHKGVYPYHSVPMTRSALEDNSTAGMVLAHFMYRDLSESEYEHMAKCATDVVQWRIDKAIMTGTARSLKDGKLLPVPNVHFRDGTITPQEREFGHYSRLNEYGDMVREGMSLTRNILDKICAGQKPPVFAGAVKSTVLQLFSAILNWYIAEGSRHTCGEAIDPNWNLTRATHVSDNDAMSLLLSVLEDRRHDGTYFVTCAICRPFYALTELFDQPDNSDYRWDMHFDRRRSRDMARYEEEEFHEPTYLASVSEISEDDFVVMCEKADYVMFYVGHTAGDPPPTIPRYEFLESLRSKPRCDADDRVKTNIRKIVAAIDRSGLSPDKEHNVFSRKSRAKIIPYVIYDAHEKCKSLGRQLESELQSTVIARLKEIKMNRGISARDVRFSPVSVRRFVERYLQATKSDRKRDADHFER